LKNNPKQYISNADVLYKWKYSLNLRYTELRENILTPTGKYCFFAKNLANGFLNTHSTIYPQSKFTTYIHY